MTDISKVYKEFRKTYDPIHVWFSNVYDIRSANKVKVNSILVYECQHAYSMYNRKFRIEFMYGSFYWVNFEGVMGRYEIQRL